MVQIETRKKKGRPSKADLQARRSIDGKKGSSAELTAAEQERRRSLRRKSFRYNIIDYDEDYLDEDDDIFVKEEDDDDDEEVRRREKKVKLVVKLNNNSNSQRGRVKSARDVDEDEEDDVEERGREVKKRRINGRGVEEEDDVEDDDDDVENGEDDVDEKRTVKRGRKVDDSSTPGTPGKENGDVEDEGPTPLPDKKQLELVLDKLQKKDTYGVYSEPVDPDELPDYHEVIANPMDFSTVRKKLADGCYSTLEEFESDVFLITSNAMQYNASDTVYHKQARAIKELAERKFQRVRLRIERSEQKTETKTEPKFEAKSEQKERHSPQIKKQIKKPLWRGVQEPVGSDFSAGATLAAEDVLNSCGADLASNHERPSNHDRPIEGVSSLADHITEKAEELQSGAIGCNTYTGKGVVPKFGKRVIVVDENRRATYNISQLPVDKPESIFTTFESDKKQLIPVGLSGEYAYARSLARYAANLGQIPWNIASKRIEQLLPPDFKYGRGWIGESEPLPKALVYVAPHKDPFKPRSLNRVDSGKHNKIPEGQIPASSNLFNQPTPDNKFANTSNFWCAKSSISNISAAHHHIPLQHAAGTPSNIMLKRVDSNCLASNDQKTSAIFQQKIRVPRNTPCPETTSVMKMEPNYQPRSDQKKDIVPPRQLPQGPSATNHKLDNISQKHPSGMDKHFLQSLPFRQPESNGHTLGGLTNGKMVNNVVDSNRASSSSAGTATSIPQMQDQSLSDPVLVMKMLTEKAQRQMTGSVHPEQYPSQPRSSVPSPRVDVRVNAAAAAASAWMSVGAAGFRPPAHNPFSNRSPMLPESLYNGTQVFYPQAMQSHADSEKTGMGFPGFAPAQNRPIGISQMGNNDLSRFQAQTPWQGLTPHIEQKQKQKQKQDTLPPDLNVAFQSSVDSQQPDLALQL